MQFLDNIFRGIGSMFKEGNDEILFYILVFLLFFNKSSTRGYTDGGNENDGSYILFFAVLFLFLLITDTAEVREGGSSAA